MKNFCKIALFIAVLFFAKNVFASIEITEIMYDVSGTDTNREWIEVYNNGSASVDLSKWFVFSDNTKHTITPISSSNLGAGSYAIIVQNVDKFAVDNPSFSGTLFDTSWNGLSNEGDSIAMKDPELNVVSLLNYTSSMGATGDGNSLQKIGGSFVSSNPTPGVVNTKSAASTDDESDEAATTKTPTAIEKQKVTASETQKSITTKIIAKNTASTRVGFAIDASTIGYRKEKIDSGKFIWSFGDGKSLQESWHKPFEYAYQYPGEYILTLSYYESILSAKPIATDNITITVTDPELAITKVGNATDAYVELTNQSEDKMSLSGWLLRSGTKYFWLPEGMAILPNKSIILSSRVTLFDIADIRALALVAPNGSVVSTYPVLKVMPNPVGTYYRNEDAATGSQRISQETKSEIFPEVDLNEMKASVSDAKLPANFLPFMGLGLIVVIGIVALVFAHKKSGLRDEEIGEISASDIKIIE